MIDKKFSRHLQLFGKKGQKKIKATCVAIVGVGGLGTHMVQQLSLLGVGSIILIDNEELDETNRNRYIGVWHNDPAPGTRKVDIGERLAKLINQKINIQKVHNTLRSREAFDAIHKAEYIFGCLDNEGARLILNEFCAAYAKPYFDLATEIFPGDKPIYGGRICIALNGEGCIVCYNQIDLVEAGKDLENPDEKRQRKAIYGVAKELLNESGPSVVSINGAVASLATTEFFATATNMREPKKLIIYRGDHGKVTVSTDLPEKNCYYCKSIYNNKDKANLKRYFET